MTNKEHLEEGIRKELILKYSNNHNGKVSLYLKDDLLTIIDAYADYKATKVMYGSRPILSLQQFLMALALRNLDEVKELVNE